MLCCWLALSAAGLRRRALPPSTAPAARRRGLLLRASPSLSVSDVTDHHRRAPWWAVLGGREVGGASGPKPSPAPPTPLKPPARGLALKHPPSFPRPPTPAAGLGRVRAMTRARAPGRFSLFPKKIAGAQESNGPHAPPKIRRISRADRPDPRAGRVRPARPVRPADRAGRARPPWSQPGGDRQGDPHRPLPNSSV